MLAVLETEAIGVAVIGAGLMGAQIGCEYALGGHRVTFVVRDVGRARARVDDALGIAKRFDLASRGLIREATRRMEYCPGCSSDDPVELAVECLVEDRAVKSELLASAAASWPMATIATNTSSIAVSELGRLADVERRIVGTHYWNPPLLMPLVEVLGGDATEPDRIQRVIALLRGIGKRPVELRAEAPGLVWNRIQSAVLRESLWLVEHGIATPAVIDEIMRDGLARRWRFTGPFETVSLGGEVVFDAIAANLFPTLSNARDTTGFGPHLIEDAKALRALRERRDESLAAEVARDRQARTDHGDTSETVLPAPTRPRRGRPGAA